ncbi:MAG: sensor histidine kinase [Thermoplasmatota archaeon]
MPLPALSRIEERFRRFAVVVALVAGAASALVLVGWFARVPRLAALGAPVAMKANTALGILVLAVAVFASSFARDRKAREAVAVFAGGFVAILAALTLFEYASGRSLGIDTLLVRDAGATLPGRPGLGAAFALLFLGVSLFASRGPFRRDEVADAFALLGGGVGVLGVVGNLFGISPLVELRGSNALVLPAALSFIALACASLFSRPRRGAAGILTSDDAGGALARRLAGPAVLLPLVLGYLVLLGLRAGLYRAASGVAMFALVLTVAFAVVVVHTARRVGSEATGRQRAENALAAESRFRALLEAAPDPIILVDANGRVALVNEFAEIAFGRKRRELLGLSFAELVAREPGVDPVGEHAAFGLRRDGSRFPVDVRSAPIESEGGAITFYVVRDVTEERRADEVRAAALDRMREVERLRELDEFKTQFINTAAHELGTPLTPIKLQLEILQGSAPGVLDARQRKALDVFARNVARLERLVRDILEVARQQAGRLGVQTKPEDLGRIVSEVAESFEEAAREAGLTLEMKIAPGIIVEADAQRLGQVVLNLLNNAWKFTPRGGRITVETRAAVDSATVSVSDTGPGLAREDIARLFKPFSQVHDPMQTSKPGTGLGLYICRGIVDLHHGTIWAESPGRGRGSTFSFTIPLSQPLAVATAKPRAPIESLTPEAGDAALRRAKELI